jgi:hypothetical protein
LPGLLTEIVQPLQWERIRQNEKITYTGASRSTIGRQIMPS